MTDPIVTHADLKILRRLRVDEADLSNAPNDDAVIRLLDRLIEAAEADAPTLPEGWYLYARYGGGQAVLFVDDEGDVLEHTGSDQRVGTVADLRDRLTPLRPTVTEADFSRARDRAWAVLGNIPVSTAEAALRAAFEAAGIEVRDA